MASDSLVSTTPSFALAYSFRFHPAILAKLLADFRIGRFSIDFGVCTVVKSTVLGKPDHQVLSRLQKRAARKILIAPQLKGVLSILNGKNHDTVTYFLARYCDFLRLQLFL